MTANLVDQTPEIALSEITFLEKLKEATHSAVFKVTLHGTPRILKVYRTQGPFPASWLPPDREVDLFIREASAYQRLKSRGLCARGLIPEFLGTVRHIQPARCRPSLDMFLADEQRPNGVVVEYIPHMQRIDLSTFSAQRLVGLRRILADVHAAGVLHGDPNPRNMMVVSPVSFSSSGESQGESQGEAGAGAGQTHDKVLWIDFDAAQTFEEDVPLTSRQEMWFKQEVEMMEYFVEQLPLDYEDGEISRTWSYYYNWG